MSPLWRRKYYGKVRTLWKINHSLSIFKDASEVAIFIDAQWESCILSACLPIKWIGKGGLHNKLNYRQECHEVADFAFFASYIASILKHIKRCPTRIFFSVRRDNIPTSMQSRELLKSYRKPFHFHILNIPHWGRFKETAQFMNMSQVTHITLKWVRKALSVSFQKEAHTSQAFSWYDTLWRINH